MKPFRYYVRDTEGNIEMEIFNSAKRPESYVTIHYPRLEAFPMSSPLLSGRTTFKEMRIADFGYMLFAYSRDEFVKFDAFLKEWLKANSETDCET